MDGNNVKNDDKNANGLLSCGIYSSPASALSLQRLGRRSVDRKILVEAALFL